MRATLGTNYIGWCNGKYSLLLVLSLDVKKRRKPQYKKHKTWDGDGVLVVKGSKAELYDLGGKMYAPQLEHRWSLSSLTISDFLAFLPAKYP